MRRAFALIAALSALAAGFGGVAHAAAYPEKSIRLIVPFAPGGGADSIGRLIAQKLSQSFGQQVVVDNRAGAGGRIGAELAARSVGDGYTLFFGGSTVFMTAPAMVAKLAYDPRRDFTHISLIAAGTYVLIRNPAFPATTIAELIALAKSKPSRLNYASSGPGGPGNLAGELFNAMAGVKIVHVPYKGSTPGLVATIAGEVELMFNNIVPALPAIRDRRVAAIAITSARRSSLLTGVPTIAESELPGFAVETYYGLSAPAGLPAAILQKLNTEIVRAVQSPDARTRLLEDGCEPVGSTPEEYARVIDREIAKWRKVVKGAGIHTE
jgi:tripartite-type tricarboxylate transporter receptor subunit TctC